ncbi:hypothetical protein B9T07_25665 [Limnospira fusiformis CCALA 023]
MGDSAGGQCSDNLTSYHSFGSFRFVSVLTSSTSPEIGLNWCRRILSQTPVNYRSSRQHRGFGEFIRL